MNEPQLLQLLERYHSGTATPDEIRQLNDWYQGLEGNKDPFFLAEADKQKMLSELLGNIHNRIITTADIAPVKRMAKWKSFAAAAAAIVIAAGAWLMYNRNETPSAALAETAVVVKPSAREVQWTVLENKEAAEVEKKLPDGSAVKLFAGATIKYKEPFTAYGKRDIYATGKVFFDVAKDSKHPFTVYAGSLATTALGTSFTVKETKLGLNVELFTGKVVIRRTANLLKGWKEDVFLKPGEQMQYYLDSERVTVTRRVIAEPAANEALAVAEPVNQSLLVFESEPLPQVMKQLMKQYNVSIIYNEEDMAGMNFSGTLQKNDSLPVILQVIARMNGLTVADKDSGFIITLQP